MSKTWKLDTKSQEISKCYKPSPQERALIEAYVARSKERVGSPGLKVPEKGGANHIEPDHPDVAIGSLLLMHALGNDRTRFSQFSCWTAR
jgi:hypothetical protein